VNIRPETHGDQESVRAMHVMSFPSIGEADLVDRLRVDGDAVISLVAIERDNVVGHAMFSRMLAPFRALGLGPVAVLPKYRKRGCAADLIKAGLTLAKVQGWAGVFVLGDPNYYSRFGFAAAAAEGFKTRYAGPHFMFLRLANEPASCSGRVDYAPAFSALT
jgi:putative acetyltransferase